jgi:hypothetical protein
LYPQDVRIQENRKQGNRKQENSKKENRKVENSAFFASLPVPMQREYRSVSGKTGKTVLSQAGAWERVMSETGK